ncbi:hypothetical protein HanXRQr2_Chr00c001g0832271 [Helianthus annuus]|uniref:Uncharacterized protein n=1 Tax=Helianthus annuus TaxID=4232 RepID=A0A251TFA8_HELAN|nr:hypothetical protein HanXRQr2_Chr00c001g0832271 [Helianthus annuus]
METKLNLVLCVLRIIRLCTNRRKRYQTQKEANQMKNGKGQEKGNQKPTLEKANIRKPPKDLSKKGHLPVAVGATTAVAIPPLSLTSVKTNIAR